MRGVTLLSRLPCNSRTAFQLSHPLRGMTQKAEDSTYSAMISTLTPCEGRDLHPMKNIGIPQLFQLSRPVRGVTVSLNSDGRGLEISTLTPCEGRGSMRFMVSMDTPVISTLTPCEGRGCPYMSKLCAEFYFFTFNATNYLYLSLLSQSVKVRTSPCFYGCLCFALP